MRSSRAADSSGQIVLAATPIGHSGDASLRLRELLEKADLVAAEDTRRLQRLASQLGIHVGGRVVSYHEHNEAAKPADLISAALEGATVLMVSDAGMPSVSDPGFRLTQAAMDAGVQLTVAPGPSAVLTALTLSGLPTDRFIFEGFLPRKAGERSRRLEEMAKEPRTMVFFEAPHRLGAMMQSVAEAFGSDRIAVIARELTKTYEEILRGTATELAQWAETSEVKGEIVVVVAGFSGEQHQVQDVVDEVLARVAEGERLKEAVAEVASARSVNKRELYDAALAARRAK